MISYNKETPILLPVFGSLEITLRIYNELQKIEPKYLYLAFDAPETEMQIPYQEQVQSIFAGIEWKCKVKTLRNKTHLGQGTAMLKAVRWFFRQEAEGIVLDGFHVPPPAFFAFCSCLLEKYRHDERIGHISGWDFRKQGGKPKTKDSYYFSKLVHTSHGWASWRRVWRDVNALLKTFPAFRKLNLIEEIPSHKPFRNQWYYWEHLDTHWEARYEYANLISNRLSVALDTRQIPVNEYEIPEMTHPVFMVNPTTEELQWQEIKYHIPAVTANKPDGIRFLQEKLLSLRTETGSRMKIPRIIHQIYEDPAGPPSQLLHIAESWKEKMPDWEYRFWNRQMVHDFLEFTCPEFSEYYYSYPFNVQRWDAIRYLILYYIGGLYVDLDYECIRPLDVLLTDSTCCMGMEPTINSKVFNKPLIVGNALMASTPKHPYMEAIIEDMKTNFHVNYRKNDSIQIMETTGPFMVSRVYERFKRKKDISLLPADLVTPLSMREVWMLRTGHAAKEIKQKIERAFAIHYFFGSWSIQTAEGKLRQK